MSCSCSFICMWDYSFFSVPGYIGCFQASNMLVDTIPPIHLPDMTISRCRTLCNNQNYTYAGLQRGSECVCKYYVTQVPVSDHTCDTVCVGNSDQVCGGDTALSFYHGKYTYV